MLRDRLRYWIVRALDRLPGRVLVWLSGEPAIVVDGDTLDPLHQLLRALRRRERAPGLVEPTHEAGRARFRREMIAFAGPRTEVRAVRDFEIPGVDAPIRVRHYAPPDDGRAAPLLVYLHGGGFVIGDLDTHDEACRILCRHAGTHVLSADYRLAPGHPFPAALEDADLALVWARGNAESLGADPARVGIGGDSAGGNLAAVVARLTTRAGRPPSAQLLIYPVTDSSAAAPRRSQQLFGEWYFLETRDRRAFAEHYVGGTDVAPDDPRVAPLHAPDLAGLPPALVVTASFDLLRDEGEAYADALRRAGVRVELWRVPGLGHGFVNMPGLSRRAREAMVDVARRWRVLSEGAAGGAFGPPSG